MRTPAPGEILDAWDAGTQLPPLERVSPLLRAATGLAADEVATLGVGERDRLLVAVRERLFGSTMRTVVDCPACEKSLEVTLPATTLLAVRPGPAVVEAEFDGYRVRCREPRTRELVDAAAADTAAGARTLLVERSVLSAERDGAPVPAADLPDGVVAAAAAALAEACPLLDVQLPIECAVCGTTWNRPFDIAAYLWRELDAWAVRLLGEVHLLAAAYGWSEPEILALPPTRRRHYLDLVGHG